MSVLRSSGGADALRRALSAAAAEASASAPSAASPVAAAAVAPWRWWDQHERPADGLSSTTRSLTTSTSSSAAEDTKPNNTTKKGTKPAGAWRSRLPPGAARPGVLLRARDPARFERMRLVLGYYDPPSLLAGPGGDGGSAAKKTTPPAPPRHATLSLLQTLWFTPDVDPYYKMALLSYRTRPLNRAVSASLPRAEALLSAVAEEAGAFVPMAGAGAGAAAKGKGGGGGGAGSAGP